MAEEIIDEEERHTTEGETAPVPDYSWMDDFLQQNLERIVEELEAGGKVSPAEFVRLIEFHKEQYGHKALRPLGRWVDGWFTESELASEDNSEENS